MTQVFDTITDALSQPVVGATVTIELITGPYPGWDTGTVGRTIVSAATALTDATGKWQVDLRPNDQISPQGTYYRITESVNGATVSLPILVPEPTGAGGRWVHDLLASPVPNYLPPVPIGYSIVATSGGGQIVGFTGRGDWAPSTAYNVNDLVTYQGSSYMALVAVSNANTTPPSDGTTWQLIAEGFSPAAYLAVTNNLSDVASPSAALGNLLPAQAGQGGKVLVTDGTRVSWIAQAAGLASVAAADATIVVGGTATAPTLKVAANTFDAYGAAGTVLPTQTGQGGKVLGTNGGSVSWIPQGSGVTSVAAADATIVVGGTATAPTLKVPANTFDTYGAAGTVLPTQTGQSGKVLTTNGSSPSWMTLPASGGSSGPQFTWLAATRTSAYTAVAGDGVPVDVTSGSVAISAPAAPTKDQSFRVANITPAATSNTCTVTAGSITEDIPPGDCQDYSYTGSAWVRV